MSKIFPKKVNPLVEQQGSDNERKVDRMQQPNNVDSNIDINLIIAGFQDKLSQLMTENIVKDATIKQLVKTIEKLKEQYE